MAVAAEARALRPLGNCVWWSWPDADGLLLQRVCVCVGSDLLCARSRVLYPGNHWKTFLDLIFYNRKISFSDCSGKRFLHWHPSSGYLWVFPRLREFIYCSVAMETDALAPVAGTQPILLNQSNQPSFLFSY